MFEKDINPDDFISLAFEKARQHLMGISKFTPQEIEGDIMLQKALSGLMVEMWKNEKAQKNFISLFVNIKNDIAFDMLSDIYEDSKNRKIITEHDKKEWCQGVTTLLSKKSNVDVVSLSDYAQSLYAIFNGAPASKYKNNNIAEELTEEYDEEEEEDDNDNEENNSSDDDDETEEEYKPLSSITRRRVNAEEKVERNPTALSSLILSGGEPNTLTKQALIENKSFALAFTNALSLQTVIAELQSSKDIYNKFLNGLSYVENEAFFNAWFSLSLRRNEICAGWSDAGKEKWLRAINKRNYSDKKIGSILNILGWDLAPKKANVKVESTRNMEEEKPQPVKVKIDNPMSKITKYYYEHGDFAKGAFDDVRTAEDRELYSKALATDSMPYWDKEGSDVLSLFATAIRVLDLKCFELAIQTLVETFAEEKRPLPIEKKKEISHMILQKVADFGGSEQEQYRDTLIDAISGYNKIKEMKEKSSKDKEE